jgi:response regulator of citrate/malate metabolism
LDAQLLISEYFSDDKNYVKLFELINEKKNPTKIIILTSIPYTFREISKLEKIQIEDIMIKPIDPKIILEVIQELETRNVLKIKN